MRIVVAPDSFKGTYSAPQVAAAISRGIRAAGVVAVELPVADGGEGTLDVVLRAMGGERRRASVAGPLGASVEADWGWIPERNLAIVEAAQACGLHLSPRTPHAATSASTAGVGQLMHLAVAGGAKRIVVAVGGTATTDGGFGALGELSYTDMAGVSIEVLSDVTVPFENAADVFARQKGADDAAVALLTTRLHAQAEILGARYRRDPRGIPRTGAAGGLSGALWAACGAELRSGADAVLDLVEFEAVVEGAGAIVVGEGRLDEQTAEGKIVSAILDRAAQTPVYAVAGSVQLNRAELAALQIRDAWSATDEERMVAAGFGIALAAGEAADICCD